MPDTKPQVVVKCNFMYLSGISKPLNQPQFTWAPAGAKRFDTVQAAHVYVAGATKMPGEYEVVEDPVK